MRVCEKDSILLFVLRAWLAAFKDKTIDPMDLAVSPHPNPLPKGRGSQSSNVKLKVVESDQ